MHPAEATKILAIIDSVKMGTPSALVVVGGGGAWGAGHQTDRPERI